MSTFDLRPAVDPNPAVYYRLHMSMGYTLINVYFVANGVSTYIGWATTFAEAANVAVRHAGSAVVGA